MKINDYSDREAKKLDAMCSYDLRSHDVDQQLWLEWAMRTAGVFVDGVGVEIGVSEDHNYILMEVCLPTTLSRHFSLRLKQYLLFLETTNDLELLQLLLTFLPLRDLLNFLAVSTHFASFKRLQSV